MDRRRAAYTRRVEKTSQREKRLAALAVLGVAAGVAGVLAPPLNIDWPNLLHEREEITHFGAASPDMRAPTAARAAPAAEQGAARRIYPYSIIPGGVSDKEELARVLEADAVVAAHYAGFDVANARAVTVTAPRAVYVSYRKGDQVYWTKKKLMLAPGETLLTDGKNEMRARCANRISDVPMFPVEANGPSESELDSFVVDDGGGLMAVAAAVPAADDLPMGTPFETTSFPYGAGLLLPTGGELVPTRGGLMPAANTPGIPPIYSGGRIDDQTIDSGPTPPVALQPPAPETPGTPNTPGTPDTPGTPGTPSTPSTPDTPGTPSTPDTPDTPGTPDTPDTPDTPGTPGTPVTPVTPDRPVTPDTPDQPDTPDTPRPDTPDMPDRPDPPGTPDNPELPPELPEPPVVPPVNPPDIPVDPEDPPTEVPEPGTLWLGGAAFAAMLWLRRKGARARG